MDNADTLDATSNWWGIEPSNESALTTLEKKVSTNVDFNPVLDAPADEGGESVTFRATKLKVVPEKSNPLQGTNATVGITTVDQFGNEIDWNSDYVPVNVTAEEIQFSTSDPQNVTQIVQLADDTDELTSDGDIKEWNITYERAGDLEITVFDTGSDRTVQSDTGVQTWTPKIEGVSVSVEGDATLPADTQSEINVTLQLLDRNGDAIERSGVPVSWSITNQTDANLTIDRETLTGNNGTATVTMSASNSGVPVDVTGISSGYNDAASFETVQGAINGSSTFEVDGTSATSDITDATVNETVPATVTLKDAGGNLLSDVEVTFSSNSSAIANQTVTTNDKGVATVNVTYPTETATFALNASATSGGQSLSNVTDTQINVTTNAGAAQEVRFTTDSVDVRTDQTESVEVVVYDQFDNRVMDSSATVNVTSADSDVLLVDGNANNEMQVSSGNATFTLDANDADETVTVSVNSSGLQNDTLTVNTQPANISTGTFTVGGSEKNFSADVNSSHNLSVKLTGSDGAAIPGDKVNFTATNENGDVVYSENVTTNESGYANTTATLPTAKGDVTFNASAEFRTNQTFSENLTVEAQPLNATALEFVGESRTVAADSGEKVTVQAVDKFGNLNTSASDEVNLTSSNVDAFTLDGSDNASKQLTNGAAEFQLNATREGGSTTLTASTANLTNTTLDLTAATPEGIEIKLGDDRIANSDAAVNNTTATIQLIDAGGNEIGVQGETIVLFSDSGISLNESDVTTDSDGSATVQVNATDGVGQTSFTANAENFSASAEPSLTVTGPAASVDVSAESSAALVGENVSITVKFVDSEGRLVPRSDDIRLGSTGSFPEQNSNAPVVTTDAENYTTSVLLTNDVAEETDVNARLSGDTSVSGLTTVDFEEPANISVTDYTVSNTTVMTGDQITVTADVENTGDLAGEFNVTLYTDGSEAQTETVNLAGGANTTVEFTTSFDAAGTHNVTVNDRDATDITVQQPATFDVSYTVSNETVQTGDEVTVTATIDNVGDVAGSTTVDFLVDGTQTDNASVSLDAGNSTTVEFTTSFDAAGTYNVTVDDLEATTITVESAGPGALPGFDNAPRDPDGDGLYEDVNGDGEVNVLDAQALFDNLESSYVAENTEFFDFTGDGEVDVLDLQRLFKQGVDAGNEQ